MHRPGVIAKQLDISTNTLRLWSTNFEDHLSPSAQTAKTEKGGSAQRRYTDEDVVVLSRAKRLLALGKTYEEVNQALYDPPTDAELEPPKQTETSALVPVQQTIDLTPLLAVLAQQTTVYEQQIGSLQDELRAVNQKLERLIELQEHRPEPVSFWQRLKERLTGV